MSVIGKRLKEARSRLGLSQERLGILAGIDEMSVSARMSQYERGVHTPGYPLAERFAEVLEVPIEYIYAKDDATAELLLYFHRLSAEDKARVVEVAKNIDLNG